MTKKMKRVKAVFGLLYDDQNIGPKWEHMERFMVSN